MGLMMADDSARDLARSFAPVIAGAPRILVLGSMPGRRSLDEQQYYAHPRNGFWPIMQALFGVDATLGYPQRLDALVKAGVAMWDVLGECERPGSLDADIRQQTIVANDLAGLLADYPGIRAVFFNGAAADDAFRKYVRPGLPDSLAKLVTCRLPSTSPAHAAMRLPQKIDAWKAAIAPYFVDAIPAR